MLKKEISSYSGRYCHSLTKRWFNGSVLMGEFFQTASENIEAENRCSIMHINATILLITQGCDVMRC